ncbi:MAG: zinc-binding dehydrogenase [Planctomycetes bacterium]|nr:zinc-binding dehydrogenase [Planctomycetota bacterium]
MDALPPISGRVAVFSGAGVPHELRTAPLPALQRGELLVRNDFATLCGSDLHTYSGRRHERCPTILGHEVVGTLAARGPHAPERDVRGAPLRVGDRITWAVFANDPDDPRSRRGMPQKAENLFKYGHERLTADSGFHGGFGEFTVLRRHSHVARVADHVPDEAAAMINCAIATAAGALRLAGDLSQGRVLVLGAGALGLAVAAQAHAAGAAHIAVVDPSPSRCERALPFGAACARTAVDPEQRYEVAIDCSGAPAAMRAGLRALEVGGTAVWVGAVLPQPPVPVDAEQVVRRLLTIRGLHNYDTGDLVRAVQFTEAHHRTYPFAELVQVRFPLADLDAAFAHALATGPWRVGVALREPD